MGKLQKITRSNGSDSYSVNIPKDIIDELKWKKGKDLIVEVGKVRDSIIIFCDKVEVNSDG